MAQRATGINAPRTGITRTLAAPGVQPAMPAQPANNAALMSEFLQSASGLATGIEGIGRAVWAQRERDDLAAIEAAAREQAGHPVFKTKRVHDFYWQNEATIALSGLDIASLERMDGEDMSGAAARWLDNTVTDASPDIFGATVWQGVRLKLAKATVAEVKNAQIREFQDTLDQTQRRFLAEEDPKEIKKGVDILVALGEPLGFSEAAVRQSLGNSVVRQFADTGDVEGVKRFKDYAEVGVYGDALKQAITGMHKNNYDVLAPIYRDQILSGDRTAEEVIEEVKRRGAPNRDPEDNDFSARGVTAITAVAMGAKAENFDRTLRDNFRSGAWTATEAISHIDAAESDRTLTWQQAGERRRMIAREAKTNQNFDLVSNLRAGMPGVVSSKDDALIDYGGEAGYLVLSPNGERVLDIVPGKEGEVSKTLQDATHGAQVHPKIVNMLGVHLLTDDESLVDHAFRMTKKFSEDQRKSITAQLADDELAQLRLMWLADYKDPDTMNDQEIAKYQAGLKTMMKLKVPVSEEAEDEMLKALQKIARERTGRGTMAMPPQELLTDMAAAEEKGYRLSRYGLNRTTDDAMEDAAEYRKKAIAEKWSSVKYGKQILWYNEPGVDPKLGETLEDDYIRHGEGKARYKRGQWKNILVSTTPRKIHGVWVLETDASPGDVVTQQREGRKVIFMSSGQPKMEVPSAKRKQIEQLLQGRLPALEQVQQIARDPKNPNHQQAREYLTNIGATW